MHCKMTQKVVGPSFIPAEILYKSLETNGMNEPFWMQRVKLKKITRQP